MNIFSKLFGSKRNTPIVNNANLPEDKQKVVETLEVEPPAVELFTDSEKPKETKVIQVRQQGRITQFLEGNFHLMGIHDGYEYHSSETRDLGKRKIMAEFLLILDQQIQENQERKLKLKHLIVDVTSVSPSTLQKLQSTLEELNTSIDTLQHQKELSVDNEGWVMNAIHSYQKGFTQGLDDYIAGEELLNSIKNI